MDDGLLSRWCDLVDRPLAEAAGADLLARWSEPHRRYHSIAHLTATLDRIDELLAAEAHGGAPAAGAAAGGTMDVVRLAAFFHDAVYDPVRADNEERSALLAGSVLEALGATPRERGEIVRLVRITATHEAPPGDWSAAVLCDADLAVLGSGPEEYAAYAAAVREEYAHVPEPAFRSGRADVLAALLDRPALFATRYGRERWEDRARHNVTAELTLLRAGG